MGYVKKNLLPNEEIIYKAKIHWSIYIGGIVSIIIGIIIVSSVYIIKENKNILDLYNLISSVEIIKLSIEKYWQVLYLLGYGFIILGFIRLIKAFIYKVSTELVVTSKRVIAKLGLIRRRTMELNHNKVESFRVTQGIFQRLFDSGTIIVQGTGGGKTPIENIDSPLEFRNKAMEIIDKNQNKT